MFKHLVEGLLNREVIDVDTPFENLSKRVKEVEIDGLKIFLKPKTRDVEKFLTMSDKMTEQDAKNLSDIFTSMITRAYEMQDKKVVKEDVEDFVAEHYGSILYKTMELFGFATKEDIEKLKKKSIEKMEVKFQ